MSKPEPLSDAELIAALNDLIQLDSDAIEGYTIAINTIRNQGHREALAVFRHDHARHVEALRTLIRERGGAPARVSHIGGPLSAAVKRLGTASGSDVAVLRAFRNIERESRDRYRGCANEPYPEEMRPLLRQHARDEETHYRWIEASLEGLGIEREIADLSVDVPSAAFRSRERSPGRQPRDGDHNEPLA
jgi:rubrerythrin